MHQRWDTDRQLREGGHRLQTQTQRSSRKYCSQVKKENSESKELEGGKCFGKKKNAKALEEENLRCSLHGWLRISRSRKFSPGSTADLLDKSRFKICARLHNLVVPIRKVSKKKMAEKLKSIFLCLLLLHRSYSLHSWWKGLRYCHLCRYIMRCFLE